jgi:pimeloyl-ACP methyl ester carboxylesterase
VKKLLALALVLALSGCAVGRAIYGAPDLPARAERHTLRTPDGWELSLTRYAPEKPLAGRRPVLLLHGIITNARNLDLDDRHSLARWLASRGLDAWTLSVRGKGDSERPALIGGGKSWDWTFDSYASVDVPAAIRYILAKTGAAKLDCIGHSLGGMMLYALLARGGPEAERVASIATLGSPLGFRWGPRFTALTAQGASVALHLALVPIAAPTVFFLPLIDWYPDPLAPIFYNPANLRPSLWTSFLAVGVDDEPGTMAAQATQWLERDRFLSADGKLDYEALLARVRTPALVVAGKVDQLGFPPLVRRGYEALAGPKRWVLIAEENGASADYGHMDLLLGERAPQDVFVHLERWLADQSR